MKNWPCASETTLADLGWTVTWAPINAPLELSVTRPAIEPLPDCARATGISEMEQDRRNRIVQNLRMVTPSNFELQRAYGHGANCLQSSPSTGDFSDPISKYTPKARRRRVNVRFMTRR